MFSHEVQPRIDVSSLLQQVETTGENLALRVQLFLTAVDMSRAAVPNLRLVTKPVSASLQIDETDATGALRQRTTSAWRGVIAQPAAPSTAVTAIVRMRV
jgi:hypothetical protein